MFSHSATLLGLLVLDDQRLGLFALFEVAVRQQEIMQNQVLHLLLPVKVIGGQHTDASVCPLEEGDAGYGLVGKLNI